MKRLLLLFLVCWSVPALAGEPLGRVESVSGKVKLFRQGHVRGEKLRDSGGQIAAGDSLVTARNSRANLALVDGNRVILKESSTLLIEGRNGSEVRGGLVLFSIRKRGELRGYAVKSATVTIGVRGTRFAVGDDQGRIAVHLQRGRLLVTPISGRFRKHLQEGMAEEFRDMQQGLKAQFEQDRARLKNQFDTAREHLAVGDVEYVDQIDLEAGSTLTIEGSDAWVTPLGHDLDADFAAFDQQF